MKLIKNLQTFITLFVKTKVPKSPTCLAPSLTIYQYRPTKLCSTLSPADSGQSRQASSMLESFYFVVVTDSQRVRPALVCRTAWVVSIVSIGAVV